MRKNNKRALIVSMLSLLLCVSMLVGSTFAWFTDTATTSVSKIQAGTLNIELYKLPYTSWTEYLEDVYKQKKFINITEDTEPLFDSDKWEPGYTRVAHLALYNRGNLAAKVRCKLVPVGNISVLADVIDVYYAMYTEASFTREGLMNSKYTERVGTLRELLNGKEFPLVYPYLAGVSEEKPNGDGTMFSIILKMQEDAGNDYQGLELGAFDIRIEATQAPVEHDSFSDQYDANAEYDETVPAKKWDGTTKDPDGLNANTNAETETVIIDTPEQLAAFADAVNDKTASYAGYTVTLSADIDLNNQPWTSINGWGGVLSGTVIDGNGHTIKNMKVDGGDSAGFISTNASSLTIKNLTFEGAYVKPTEGNGTYSGVVMGKNYSNITIENVHVKNSKVISNWQAGGLVGFAEGNGPTFNNCSISDSFVGGYNCTAGAFFGLGDVAITVNGGSVTNVDLYTDGQTWNSTQKPGGDNFIVGHLYGKTLTNNGCTVTNVNVVSDYPA